MSTILAPAFFAVSITCFGVLIVDDFFVIVLVDARNAVPIAALDCSYWHGERKWLQAANRVAI
jgi:hypothetical protein